MSDEVANTEIVSPEDIKLLSNNITPKKALVNMSKDPAGLQVFIDKSKAGKLKYTVDIVKCINLKMKGVSVPDIARTQNLNGDNKRVCQWLQGYINKYKPSYDPKELEVYKDHRTSFLVQKQKEIMEGITADKIADATLKDLTVAADKLFQNERLNEDKSTSNVAHQFSSIVEQIHADRDDDE